MRGRLGDVPELRGRLRLAEAPAVPGTLGVPLELAVVLAAATTATVAALAGAVSTWLEQGRSEVTVIVTDPHGVGMGVTAGTELLGRPTAARNPIPLTLSGFRPTGRIFRSSTEPVLH
ncbi:effector-associated constant component EACC1 [Nocardia fluminea]|uniref:effector-associated constant component EACC1 n=1 Tax=Nocardia fluminea TaxID=134984 RepID=UPI0033D1449D